MSENEILDATYTVTQLDKHADIDQYDVVTLDDGTPIQGWELRQRVAQDIAHRIEMHAGVGSWAAAHALKAASTAQIRSMLIAWGASQFLLQQHARAIAAAVRSMAFSGSSNA